MARQTLFTHPKLHRLVYILGESVPLAIGCLELLWNVAYESGNEVIGDSIDVELACKWPGERGKLCRALVEVGFLDQIDGEPGRYQVHDLWDHAPDYVRKRWEREGARKLRYAPRNRPLTAAWRREKPDLGGLSADLGGLTQPKSDLGSPPSPSPSPSQKKTAAQSARSCEDAASEPASLFPSEGKNEDASDPAVLTFPCVGKGPKTWTLRASKLAEYRESYPALDALAECRKALQWTRDNPKKRKTAGGMAAFLTKWLNKAQNAPGYPSTFARPAEPAADADAILKRQQARTAGNAANPNQQGGYQ